MGEKSDDQGSPLPPGEIEGEKVPTPGRELDGQGAPVPLGGEGVTKTFVGTFGRELGLALLFSEPG